MANPKPFEDKVILITGAAQGIGECTARYLGLRGATLSLSDIKSDQLAKVVKSLEEAFPGINIHYETVDITDPAAVERWVSATKEKFGRIDGCVNNAGIAILQPPLAQVSVEHFTHMINVNLTGTFNCLKSEINHISDGGSIVNIASVTGYVAAPGLGPYAVSKHGVVGLTRQAAVENASRNIRVNAVCPSFVEGEIVENLQAASGREFDLDRIQYFGRLAKREEVAGMVGYLLGDESKFVTRAIFPIDGGVRG